MSTPPSPPAPRLRTPRWFDGRLLVGVLLVLVSVVVGARVVAAADDASRVWSLAADVQPGTTLAAKDLVVTQVRFHGNGDRYLDAGAGSLAGLVVTRALSAGELVPRDAVARPGDGASRYLVTVAVDRLHVPSGLGHGDLVDVYVSRGGKDQRSTQRVLHQIAVQDVTDSGGGLAGSGATTGVVVSVGADQVQPLIAGLEGGSVDVVRVLPGASAAADPASATPQSAGPTSPGPSAPPSSAAGVAP